MFGFTSADASKVIKRCGELQKFWQKRNTKFKEWYKLIQMVDELKQTNMESFVGNDPQSSFKLLRHLLDQEIPHRIPHELLTVQTMAAASGVSKLFETAWDDIYQRYRNRGRQGWVFDLAGLLLATGWYSVFAMVTADGKRCVAEILNPATVYPVWDDALVECSRIDTVNPMVAQRMAVRNKWDIGGIPRSNLKRYDHWLLDDSGKVYNSIVLGNKLVKPVTHEPKFDRIPIFTSPVGGLPDTGIIMEDMENWKAEIGQAYVATNANIHRYWNKWWTFSMQLLRDTAQARTLEKTKGDKKVVKPEEWNKRGGHFKVAPDEDIGFIAPPPIPVELRSTQLDLETMMQQGGGRLGIQGGITGTMTTYVMSRIAAETNQVAKPFHKGIVDCITDIDNFWLGTIRKYGYKPYDMELPKELPEDAKLTAQYELRIPGDLIQRATVARMLQPDIELSYERVMQEMFPEVKNPLKEEALIRAGKAKRHVINSIIDLVRSLREEATLLKKQNDKKGAELFEAAANKVEASLGIAEQEAAEAMPMQQGQQPAQRRQMGTRTEGLPPRGVESPTTPVV